MSRMEKFGSVREGGQPSRKMKKAAAADSRIAEEMSELPSRRVKYPSNKVQTATWFYRLLIFLFMLLMSALVLWGRHLGGL